MHKRYKQRDVWRTWAEAFLWGRRGVVSVAAVALLVGGYMTISQPERMMPAFTEVLARASGATVAHIQVVGLSLTSKQELAEVLGLQKGDSLVGFSPANVRERLENLPWVRLAAVERRLPDAIKIELYEHVPMARVEDGDNVWVVNKAGDMLVPDEEAFTGLPILSGAGAADQAASLFLLLQDSPNLMVQLEKAAWVGERRWDLMFKSGVRVQLPERESARAVSWLKKLDDKRHIMTLAGGEVDLRLEDRITLRIPDGAKADVVLGQKG